jgi:phospholipid-binding lipoprotein MlaA
VDCIDDDSITTSTSNTTTVTSPEDIKNKSDSSNGSATSDIDPFENYNRNAFSMNTKVDMNVIRPTTVWYITYIPLPIRSAIANFFNNLRDCVTLGNDILQLRGMNTMQTTMRIGLNSTIGIAGLIDVSSAMGLNMHINTFGRTMQTYGWQNSSYFIIPFLGPSTVRDALGMIPDVVFNPTWYIINSYYISIGLFLINGLDARAKYLDTDQLVYTSLDPYVTMRDFYLQNRGQSASANKDNDVSIDTLIEEDSGSSGSNSKNSGNNSSKSHLKHDKSKKPKVTGK